MSTKENKIKPLKRISLKVRHSKPEKESLNRKAVSWYFSIGFKLITSFLIPIGFVILIGVISYQKASDSILDNYQKSSQQAINMSGQYLNFGFESIKSTALQYIMDKRIQAYFYGASDSDEFELGNNKRELQTDLSVKVTSDEFLENIFILSPYIDTAISSKNTDKKGLYDTILQSEEGSGLKEKSDAGYWIGNSSSFDTDLGVSQQNYAIRYIDT